MLFKLDPGLAAILGEAERTFDGILALTGQVLREREGRRTLRVTRPGGSIIVKLHLGVGYGLLAKHLLAGRLPVTSAANEWQALDAMAAAGLRGPRVLGRGLRGRNPAALQSFVVLEDLGAAPSLEDLAAGGRPGATRLRRLVREVAVMTRRLHALGINHRDLNLSHFLEVPGEAGLCLIDLHRAALRRRVPRRWQVKDLGHLYYSCFGLALSRGDRLRFVEAYAGRRWRLALAQDGALWRQVAAKADRIAAKERRRAQADA